MSNYNSVKATALRNGLDLRRWVIAILLMRDHFGPLIEYVEPENELLRDASKVGLDPLEIIRSHHYNINPQHYERSI